MFHVNYNHLNIAYIYIPIAFSPLFNLGLDLRKQLKKKKKQSKCNRERDVFCSSVKIHLDPKQQYD